METDADEILSEYLSSEYAQTAPESPLAARQDENVEAPTSGEEQFLQALNQQVQELNACLQRMTQELRQLNRSLVPNTEPPAPTQNTAARVRNPLGVFQRPLPRRVTRAAERVHRITYPPR